MKLFLAFFLCSQAFAHYVQVGDSYSKFDYKDVYRSESNQHLDNLIENTVLINSRRRGGVSRGTGFYIGKHGGNHVFVTNAHVMSESECSEADVSFLVNGMVRRTARCEKVLFSRFVKEKSDITVFTVKESMVSDMLGRGLEIDWDFKVEPGVKVAQAGFGLKTGSFHTSRLAELRLKRFNMEVSFDSDCVISSKKDTLYFLENLNAEGVFSTGCDMASGDSGSALMDRESGKVLGLVFATSDNKFWTSSEIFWQIIGSDNKRLWQNGSYAISLASLKEFFLEHGVQ